MILNKMIKYAGVMGMDVDELMELSVLDAMVKIEETRLMWVRLKEDVEKT